MLSIKIRALLQHPFNSKKRKEYRLNHDLKIFHSLAYDAIKTLSKTIEDYQNKVNHSCRVWLEFGTLLGAYRENNFISHDNDIDLGIDEKSFNQDFINHLEENGFILKKYFKIKSNDTELNDFIAEITVSYKNKINIDFFVFKSINNRLISYCFDKSPEMSSKQHQQKYGEYLRVSQSQFIPFELKNIEFLGEKFLIPSNTIEHLTECYGADFMTPKKYSFKDRPRDYESLLDDSILGKTYYK